MPDTSPNNESSIREPHPLALLLIERLPRASRVLDFAAGSGRNAVALERAGLRVTAIDDAAAERADPFAAIPNQRFDAAISTHGFLHGTATGVAARVRCVANRLESGAALVATFGSIADRRYGCGTRIDAQTFAPLEGDERGVAHAFFDREGVTAMLDPAFALESLEERNVDDIAGKWAHAQSLERAVHWFAVAVRR